jgi:hypothetical protein
VTVDKKTLQCDAFGCRTEATLDVPQASTDGVRDLDAEVRRHFSGRHWTRTAGTGWGDACLDLCPYHAPKARW